MSTLERRINQLETALVPDPRTPMIAMSRRVFEQLPPEQQAAIRAGTKRLFLSTVTFVKARPVADGDEEPKVLDAGATP